MNSDRPLPKARMTLLCKNICQTRSEVAQLLFKLIEGWQAHTWLVPTTMPAARMQKDKISNALPVANQLQTRLARGKFKIWSTRIELQTSFMARETLILVVVKLSRLSIKPITSGFNQSNEQFLNIIYSNTTAHRGKIESEESLNVLICE